MLEKTITDNQKVRCSTQYQIAAGIDNDGVPQLLKTDSEGRLIAGGADLPAYDAYSIDRYGSTNNIHRIIYTKSAVEVARWTFLYVGGGAANDDKLLSGQLTRA